MVGFLLKSGKQPTKSRPPNPSATTGQSKVTNTKLNQQPEDPHTHTTFHPHNLLFKYLNPTTFQPPLTQIQIQIMVKQLRDSNGVSIIAQPLANEKLVKKTLKVVKKAAKAKLVRRGIKEVQKAIRKNQTGVCVIAGDISPIDVICHIPVVCEEAGIPYVFVPSKAELGAAVSTKRPTSCLLITGDAAADWEHLATYKELKEKIAGLEQTRGEAEN
jgi:H/ACA ribonucleoprotein complex subunit 2